MKKSRYLWLLVGILIIASVNIVSASVYLSGEMDAKILKVISPFKYNEKEKYYECKIEVKFTKLRFEGGFYDNHGQCKELIGKTKTIEIKQFDEKNKELIKKNNMIVIKYGNGSGFNSEGPYNWVSWELKGVSIDFDKHKPVLFEKDNLYGYKDHKGNVIITAKYYVAGDFSEYGIAAVADKNSWYYIDYYEHYVITPFIFDNAPDSFEEGLARYVENEKMGFFNEKGKVVIPAKYDFVEPFYKGFADVSIGCKKDYIGENYIMKGGNWGVIDKKGNIIVEVKYNSVILDKDGLFVATTHDNKKIIIDRKGKKVSKKQRATKGDKLFLYRDHIGVWKSKSNGKVSYKMLLGDDLKFKLYKYTSNKKKAVKTLSGEWMLMGEYLTLYADKMNNNKLKEMLKLSEKYSFNKDGKLLWKMDIDNICEDLVFEKE